MSPTIQQIEHALKILEQQRAVRQLEVDALRDLRDESWYITSRVLGIDVDGPPESQGSKIKRAVSGYLTAAYQWAQLELRAIEAQIKGLESQRSGIVPGVVVPGNHQKPGW